jgi:hypothetical protein
MELTPGFVYDPFPWNHFPLASDFEDAPDAIRVGLSHFIDQLPIEQLAAHRAHRRGLNLFENPIADVDHFDRLVRWRSALFIPVLGLVLGLSQRKRG